MLLVTNLYTQVLPAQPNVRSEVGFDEIHYGFDLCDLLFGVGSASCSCSCCAVDLLLPLLLLLRRLSTVAARGLEPTLPVREPSALTPHEPATARAALLAPLPFCSALLCASSSRCRGGRRHLLAIRARYVARARLKPRAALSSSCCARARTVVVIGGGRRSGYPLAPRGEGTPRTPLSALAQLSSLSQVKPSFRVKTRALASSRCARARWRLAHCGDGARTRLDALRVTRGHGAPRAGAWH